MSDPNVDRVFSVLDLVLSILSRVGGLVMGALNTAKEDAEAARVELEQLDAELAARQEVIRTRKTAARSAVDAEVGAIEKAQKEEP